MRFSSDGPADLPAPAWRACLALLLAGPTVLLSPLPQADRSPFGESDTLGSPLCYPRPMYGIFVAITVMNGTLASSGRLAM